MSPYSSLGNIPTSLLRKVGEDFGPRISLKLPINLQRQQLRGSYARGKPSSFTRSGVHPSRKTSSGGNLPNPSDSASTSFSETKTAKSNRPHGEACRRSASPGNRSNQPPPSSSHSKTILTATIETASKHLPRITERTRAIQLNDQEKSSLSGDSHGLYYAG